MNKIRKLQLRTISLILTLTMIMGCVCSTASAEMGSDYVDKQNGSSIDRVYDSGNVTLSNKVEVDKKNKTFKIKLNVKVGNIAKLSSKADSVSSAAESTEVKDSGSIAPKSETSLVRASLTRAVAAPQQEAAPYEVRYYINPNFELVASSIANGTVKEEDGKQYVSWPNLTAEGISSFTTDLQLQPKTTDEDSDDSNPDDQSGVYMCGEPVYLFAQMNLASVAQLPPITAKTATLKDWADRTYDINLSITAQSKLVSSTNPCDIILVLDRSGSMAQNIVTYSYSPITENPNKNNAYFIDLNGGYQKVSYGRSNKYGRDVWYYNNSNDNVISPLSGGHGEQIYVDASSVSTSYNYYIDVDGTYKKVRYYKPNGRDSKGNKYQTAWYYDNGGTPVRVYPSQSGGSYSPKFTFKCQSISYQFYTQTQSSQTKQEALKTAAKKFVENVKSNSPDSRIGLVEFSERVYVGWGEFEQRANIISNLNGKSLLKVGNADSLAEINSDIDGLPAEGATAADYGLQKAKELYDNTDAYEAVTTQTGRKKVVVFFTDGEPNHSSGYSNTVAADAIKVANELKAAPYNATVYSIGVFAGLTGTDLTRVETYMKGVASPKPSPSTEKQYYPASDATALNSVFDSISQEVGNISSATVTDEIDPRFELTAASRDELLADDKVTIVGNKITWNGQAINVKKDDQGNLIPDWTKFFTVQAKNQFIGGNAISTNVKASSGVAYGTNLFEKFPQPTVNVRPEFYISNAENTIFYGEEVPVTTLSRYKVSGQDIFCGQGATGTFTQQWLKADGTTQIGTAESFPTGQLINDDTYYTLKAKFIPSAATAESNANSKIGTRVYTAGTTENTVIANSAEGKYTVRVVKGQLNITKNINKKYPAPAVVNAKQSFVFKIQCYGNLNDFNNQANPEIFYEVITPSDTLSGNKTISGLKKGYYKVTEENGDAWRYTQQTVSDNDDTLGAAGSVFIGRETSAAGAAVKTYFGVTPNPATVQFTNTLTKGQWLGDTTVAVNTIRQ